MIHVTAICSGYNIVVILGPWGEDTRTVGDSYVRVTSMTIRSESRFWFLNQGSKTVSHWVKNLNFTYSYIHYYTYQRSAIPVCRRSIPIPIPPEGQGQYPIPIPILQSAWGQYPIPIPILVLPKGQYQYQYQYWHKVLYLNIITNTLLLSLLSGKEINSIDCQKWYCYFHSV